MRRRRARASDGRVDVACWISVVCHASTVTELRFASAETTPTRPLRCVVILVPCLLKAVQMRQGGHVCATVSQLSFSNECDHLIVRRRLVAHVHALAESQPHLMQHLLDRTNLHLDNLATEPLGEERQAWRFQHRLGQCAKRRDVSG